MVPLQPDPSPESGKARVTPPGLVHSYQAYDPKNFPSPTAPAPDIASAAMEHMMAYGSMRDLTPEELARAIKLDPSMFPSLGPSIEALRALLEARKKKILGTYESDSAIDEAAKRYTRAVNDAQPDKRSAKAFAEATRDEQLGELENLWEAQRDDQSDFSRALMRTIATLGDKYQVDALVSKYTFTGREPLSVAEAIALRDELEAIDKLLEQLAEAAKNAQIGIIDLEELSQYVDEAKVEELNKLQKQIEEYVKQEAERQGLESTANGFRLSPHAYKLFQSKLLQEIFSDLEAARSGRHTGPIVGEGAVEIERTKPYEFGDSVAHLDLVGSFTNAMIRRAANPASNAPGTAMLHQDDMLVHRTRNNPKCATVVLLDMSGSMRYGGQYVQVKRMGLALDALIRREYPGDFLRFVEMFTMARLVSAPDLASLMPKLVSIHSPVVRLRADLANPETNEALIPQHFTNIQRAMQLGRQMLSVQDTPNRQLILITDGLPTAHFEGQHLYMLYPPDPRTEEATMREANLCAKENITINIFLLPSWSQTSEDVKFAQAMAQRTKGRVFFTGGADLDRYVLWDYVSMRRKVIA